MRSSRTVCLRPGQAQPTTWMGSEAAAVSSGDARSTLGYMEFSLRSNSRDRGKGDSSGSCARPFCCHGSPPPGEPLRIMAMIEPEKQILRLPKAKLYIVLDPPPSTPRPLHDVASTGITELDHALGGLFWGDNVG